MFTFHKEFTLNGLQFDNQEDIVSYLKNDYQDTVQFLEEWFDKNDYVTVNTSGSTGNPKPIKILKKNMLISAETTALFFRLSAKTTALHCLSSQYIAGKMMWVRALHLGWHLTLVEPKSVLSIATHQYFDFAAMLPMQIEYNFEKLKQFQTIIVGGAPISVELESKLLKQFPNIYATYGMTETITHVAVRKIGQKHYQALPKIIFDIDQRNCLQIKAPYQKQIISTNDVVELIDNQNFIWLGRFDNIVNSGGVKLFPEQIEQKLQPFINVPFVISSVEDSFLGQKLVLVHKISNDILDLKTIFQQAGLLKFEIPKQIIAIEDFVYTNNKINRKYINYVINK